MKPSRKCGNKSFAKFDNGEIMFIYGLKITNFILCNTKTCQMGFLEY